MPISLEMLLLYKHVVVAMMPKRKTESRTNYAGAVRSRADTSYHCIGITFHKWNKLNLLDLDLCYSVNYAGAVRSRADTCYHCIGII